MVGGYFPFFGPLIISLRLGYLKAVSTSCWQIVSTSEVITIHMSSVLLIILILIIQAEKYMGVAPIMCDLISKN